MRDEDGNLKCPSHRYLFEKETVNECLHCQEKFANSLECSAEAATMCIQDFLLVEGECYTCGDEFDS